MVNEGYKQQVPCNKLLHKTHELELFDLLWFVIDCCGFVVQQVHNKSKQVKFELKAAMYSKTERISFGTQKLVGPISTTKHSIQRDTIAQSVTVARYKRPATA